MQGGQKMKIVDRKTNGTRFPRSNWEKFKDLVNIPSETSKPRRSQASNLKFKPDKRKSSNALKTAIKSEMNFERIGGSGSGGPLPPKRSTDSTITKHIGMDCEMVGTGNDGTDSMIARVSIVNRYGVSIYDKYVKPREKVTNYRTSVSGIRPSDLENAEEFATVQKEVAEILRNRILVGHALKNDLNVLFLSHPKKSMRDTSRYKPFRKITKGNTPSLKKLASEVLGVDIQKGEHNSVEDARAAMELYLLYKNKWEMEFHNKR